MTPAEARQVLRLHRPGSRDPIDPLLPAALALARQDPELGAWFNRHCAFQTAARAQLRAIKPPAGLKERLLARRVITPPPAWWRRPAPLALAAALVLLASLASFWLRPQVPDRFADYRDRMVRAMLRQYRMDVLTTNMSEARAFLALQGAPADYRLPRGLDRLALTGAGKLQWRGAAVSMVCFDRGDRQMLYFFVLPRSVLKDPPPAVARLVQVSKLTTACWTEDDKTFLLAGPPEADFAAKYL